MPRTTSSLQALAFARGLGAPVHAVLYGAGARDVAPGLGAHGVATAHVADGDGFDAYAPMAWAQGLVQLAAGADAVVGPGTDRGMEVLAHVAARLDLPFSASCVAAALGSPTTVTRVRWGGTLHEQALLHGAPALLTVAPHAVPAAETGGGPAAVEALAPTLAPGDLAVRVAETVARRGGQGHARRGEGRRLRRPRHRRHGRLGPDRGGSPGS